MTKTKLLISFFSLCFCNCSTLISFSQNISPGTDHIISPIDHSIQNKWVFKKSTKNLRHQEDLYTIPVVFHIIHTNGSENIPDAEVMNAFQHLNDAFANSGIFDQGSGVDTKIQFCLAKKDPDGNYTTGITRTHADIVAVNPAVNQDLLESLIKWDPSRYLNIWIVREVDLAIELKHCGIPGMMATGYGGGGIAVLSASSAVRIIIHEVGHALGLLHTFEGWCVNNNCLIDGDGICDTPPEETVTIVGGCTDPENSCHTDQQSGFSRDQNDLKTNHMDYGNQPCTHDFTEGQKDKMRFVIETFFPGWITGDVCDNDCTSSTEAEFLFPALTEYSIGNTITFSNASTGASSYEWSVNNTLIATTNNLTYNFPGQGWYKISLLAKSNPDEIKCRNNQVNWIRVYCSIKSLVKTDKRKARLGEPVHFSCTLSEVVNMPGTVSYEWYYDGILFGNTPEFDYSFTTPGVKLYYLVTIRGACRDTSLKNMVDIKDLPDYTIDLNKKICASGNVVKKIGFSLCNKGDNDLPAGIPVTFYNSDPTKTAATMVGSTFFTTVSIPRYCCKDFEFELPTGFSGNFLFGVVNDNHSKPTPFSLFIDFPVTEFQEIKYTNNLDSISLEKMAVKILPDDVAVPIGGSVNLAASLNGQASLLWTCQHGSFSCDTCANTSFAPQRYTRVIISATSDGGCWANDTINARIIANGEVFITSAFTPNNDGLNDYFFVLAGEAVSRISNMMIFNRWGEAVFNRQNLVPNIPHLGWNGKFKGYPAIPGAYVYLVSVEFLSGVTKNYKGIIILVR